VEIASLTIDAVKLIRPRRHTDARGFFVEIWNKKSLAKVGIDVDFVQDNLSYSRAAATIRGLHYQTPPVAQAKLVFVPRGSIFDVAVDLRRASPTFGGYVSALLSAAGGEQLYIPPGFAHGYCTLESDTEVAYKVSQFHSPEHEAGIVWNDPAIGIPWPIEGREAVLSEKDRNLPRLADLKSPF
jgi:dTDP-4-dehydrorhamnose 3,5-epimerase